MGLYWIPTRRRIEVSQKNQEITIEADDGRSYTTEQPEHPHTRIPWRLSLDCGEKPQIYAECSAGGGARVGVCEFHMCDECDEQEAMHADERDSEQGSNMALILESPVLLKRAREALANCDGPIGSLERLVHERVITDTTTINLIAAARNSLDLLDESLDRAVDVGWFSVREEEEE